MDTKNRAGSVLLGLFALAGLFGVWSIATAAGLTIAPAIIEERIDPGQTLSKTITVTNESDSDATYIPAVRDIETMTEDGHPVYVEEGVEPSGAELSSWTTFVPERINLAPGQRAEVTMVITIPGDAPNGGFFGTAVFLNEAGVDVGGEQPIVDISFEVGSLVALRVGDDVTDDAIVRSFRSSRRIFGTPDASFETRIENTGNALIRPIGIIEVSDMFGRRVASTSFNEGAGAILPGVVRQYDSVWVGQGTHIGRYDALLVVSYGDTEKKTLTATTSFWVIPGKLALIVGGVFVALFLLAFGWSRMYISRRLKAAGVSSAKASGGSSASVFLAALIAVIVTTVVLLGFAFFFLV